MQDLPGNPSLGYVEQEGIVRLQLSNFFKVTREQLTSIFVARESLEYIYALFSDEEDVWPSQCDRVITYLHEVKEPVQAFCDLLDDSAELPPVLSTYIFQLVISLNLVNEQIQKLIALVSAYRSICRSPSGEAMRLRQEFDVRLGRFLRTSEDEFQKVAHLLDEAHFPDRQALDFRETDSLEVVKFNDENGFLLEEDHYRSKNVALHRIK